MQWLVGSVRSRSCSVCSQWALPAPISIRLGCSLTCSLSSTQVTNPQAGLAPLPVSEVLLFQGCELPSKASACVAPSGAAPVGGTIWNVQPLAHTELASHLIPVLLIPHQLLERLREVSAPIRTDREKAEAVLGVPSLWRARRQRRGHSPGGGICREASQVAGHTGLIS